jgi:hypothetical protein
MYSICEYFPKSTYIYRIQSSVWRLPNYWPPPLSPPSECVLPPHQRRGGVHTRRVVRGWGVYISEDARHWIGLVQYNPSTVLTKQYSICPAKRYHKMFHLWPPWPSPRRPVGRPTAAAQDPPRGGAAAPEAEPASLSFMYEPPHCPRSCDHTESRRPWPWSCLVLTAVTAAVALNEILFSRKTDKEASWRGCHISCPVILDSGKGKDYDVIL